MISEILIGALALVVAFFSYLLYGAQNDRIGQSRRNEEKTQEQLDDWSGVLDVKREIDNRLSDPDERKRVREKYNKSKPK